MEKEDKNKPSSQKVTLTGEGVLSIALNAGYLFTSRWVTMSVRFIYAIILTRFLGPELYGYLNYGISWYLLFFPIASMSLDIILSREVGRNRKKGAEISNQILTSRLYSSLLAAFLCGAIGLFIEEKEVIKILLLIFSFALMGRSLWFCAQSIFSAYEMSGQTMRLHAVFRPLEVIVGLVVLMCGGGVVGVAVIHGVSWWLQAMRGFFLIHRLVHPIRMGWKWRVVLKFFIIGLPISVGNVLNMWLVNGPLVMYKYYIGTGKGLGQLALAMQVLMLLLNLLTVLFMASLPLISRSASREDGKDVYFADAMLRFGLMLGVVAGITALGTGDWLVKLFFGSKFYEAGKLIGYVLWLLIPSICGNAIWNIYMARGKYILPMISAAIGALLFVVVFPWLAVTMDTLGAVISAGIGMSCSTLILGTFFVKQVELNVRRVILYPLAAVVIVSGLYFALNSMDLSVWVSLPVSYIGFFICIFLFGIITPFERKELSNLIKRKFG